MVLHQSSRRKKKQSGAEKIIENKVLFTFSSMKNSRLVLARNNLPC